MEFHSHDWQALATTMVGGGLIAGLVMGVILQAGNGIIATIGSVSGSSSMLIGWIVHLLLSVVFAAGFLVVLASKPIEVAFDTPTDTLLLGLIYGALLGSVTWGFVIPVSVGFESAFPLDFSPKATSVARFSIVLGLGHLTYGLVLSAIVIYRHRPMPLFADEEDGIEG
ncbi:hypothetical protein [Salinarchaeum laminariae]|uniref:hypothetical protein n=1 Tax=Salinarchaeum laminariae TaxID=869888 RepID=UPI0020BFF53D|nr:hypothetical protein [Salinarchaeum laminariae]